MFAGIFVISGERKSEKVQIFNGKNESYLMVKKDQQDSTRCTDVSSYSVFVAPRKGVSMHLLYVIVVPRDLPDIYTHALGLWCTYQASHKVTYMIQLIYVIQANSLCPNS